MKTIIKIIMAAAMGFGLMCVAILCDASDRVCLTVYFSSALVFATLFGVFDIPEQGESIRKEEQDAGEAQMRDAA